jgi:hypothetical protein
LWNFTLAIELHDRNWRFAMTQEGQAAPAGEHGKDEVSVSIDGVTKSIHRGSYTTEDLKTALGVAAQRELDIIEDGVFRTLAPGSRITVKEGMEFISRQPAGGSS